jgi:hypothetical protein
MNNLFYTELKHIWDNQSIPLITWELRECNGLSPIMKILVIIPRKIIGFEIIMLIG